MKIRKEFKIRDIAGESVVIMQGRYGVDMTKVISLNESSLYLWNRLSGVDFDVQDVANALTEEYDVSSEVAAADAQRWVDKLNDCKLIEF